MICPSTWCARLPLAGLALLVSCVMGCSGESKKDSGFMSGESLEDGSLVADLAAGRNPWRPEKLPDDAPTVKTTVREFVQLSQTDSVAFKEKFGGKWVEITGPVYLLSVETGDAGGYLPRIMLAEKEDESQPLTASNIDFDALLNCYTPGTMPWEHVNLEQRVTLRGVPAAVGFLDHCTIVSTGGEPVPKLTAKELAQAFKTSPQDAKDTYHEKYVVLSGTVDRNGVDEAFYMFGAGTVLDGDGETDIGLHYAGAAAESQFKDLQAADEIAVIGKCHVITDDDDGLSLGIEDASRVDLLGDKQ